ncbi:MAG: Fe-S cluster assembly ATPase SufC [Acidimicrobiia bacterium]|nr:Fe-S cluster assembly ATPase SufC [Acidimicrobiia bacterium]
MVSRLVISGLRASVDGFEILRGVDLEVASGEVHVVMGPNGSGKSTLSHVVMGRSDYAVTAGSITLDGDELLDLPTWQRAARGLFLAMQYPVAVPGVPVGELVAAAARTRGDDPAATLDRVGAEATRLAIRDEFLTRGVNDEFSGGEQKRMETLQLAVLRPKIAVLDEIDSGLDIDAVRSVAEAVEEMRSPEIGILIITHYSRILRYMTPDRIHVMIDGRVVDSGGAELADELEDGGYDAVRERLGIEKKSAGTQARPADFFTETPFDF